MKAAIQFTGVVKGKEKLFRLGDPISNSEANELGLSGKPQLVAKDKKQDAEPAKS